MHPFWWLKVASRSDTTLRQMEAAKYFGFLVKSTLPAAVTCLSFQAPYADMFSVSCQQITVFTSPTNTYPPVGEAVVCLLLPSFGVRRQGISLKGFNFWNPWFQHL
ncbi:hypothetical protein PIB30_118830 [Stylosanthes scabra]|uniref:Uncharacterized protein n=1 Tax=Stylosanthes scabra TaxID=79078 RepID=A0ABU6QNE6_9FABA|nr:hypothetical protein [Stylosanthes scabra]